MAIKEILRRIWLLSANKIKTSAFVNYSVVKSGHISQVEKNLYYKILWCKIQILPENHKLLGWQEAGGNFVEIAVWQK